MNPRALTSSAVACLAIVAAACGSSSSSGSAGSDAKTVAVTLSDEGCSPANATVPAGAVNFTVSNSGSAKVTELELLNEDGVIIGERENVIEGMPGSFSLKLQPGSYKLSCPNGDTTPEGTLKVTGNRSGAQPRRVGRAAHAGHHRLQAVRRLARAAKLQTAHRRVRGRAQGRRPRRRPRICSARRASTTRRSSRWPRASATSTPRSTRASTTSPIPSKWTGLPPHREDPVGRRTRPTAPAPYADKLHERREHARRRRSARSRYQPAQLANGSVELLNEVASSKITGEEDRYSHTDLSDFQGNLDRRARGVQAAAPALVETGNGALAKTIAERVRRRCRRARRLQAPHAARLRATTAS